MSDAAIIIGKSAGTVRRRHVLFIQGFDPRGPAMLHGLAVREAAKAQAISGVAIDVGPRTAGGSRWSMTARYGGADVHTVHEVLRWDDIVRRLWIRSELVLLWRALRWIWLCHRRGLLAATRGPALALHRAIFVPAAAGLLFLLSLLTAMAALAVLGGWLAGLAGLPLATGTMLALPLALAARRLWRWLEAIFNVCWLNRAFGYLLDHATGRLDGATMADRQQAFARRILEVARSGEADEIVVIGHSIGSMHAVEALAAAVAEAPDLGRSDPPVVLVTLGQCIPVPLVLSDDSGLRRSLVALGACGSVPWLDVTSLSDPASACGLDPLQGVAPRRADFPLSRTPAFHEILSQETFWYIRRRPIEFHFQYLKASERGGGYDYFRLVLGPQPVFGSESQR